jgi:hypothetical protein
MNVAAYALCLALSQAPETTPPPRPAAAAPAAEGDIIPPIPLLPTGPSRPKGTDEVNRLLARLPSMKPEERMAALEAISKQYGQVDSNPVLPGVDVDLDRYLGLEPAQQAQVVARGFFVDLIAADTGRLVARSGFPFFMEAKRIDRAEDLRTQWGKSLRSRRADLLKLYSVDVFLPQDMEKKYGKPPQRLNGWNWRSPNTYVAVGNLSGHATVLLLHQAGAAWQVVGFHD